MKKLIFLLTVMASIAWMDAVPRGGYSDSSGYHPAKPVITRSRNISAFYEIENMNGYTNYAFFESGQFVTEIDQFSLLHILPKSAIKNDSLFLTHGYFLATDTLPREKIAARLAYRIQKFRYPERFYNSSALITIDMPSQGDKYPEKSSDPSVGHRPQVFEKDDIRLVFVVNLQERYKDSLEVMINKIISRNVKGTFSADWHGHRDSEKAWAEANPETLSVHLTLKSGKWTGDDGKIFEDLWSIYEEAQDVSDRSTVYWIILSLAALTLIVIVILRRRKSKA